MSRIIRRSLQTLAGLAALGLLAVGGLVVSYIVLAPGLPSVEAVRNVELQVPLRVYTTDGELIDEFGEMRRTPVTLSAVPASLQQAFIAAEDQRFRQHPGVDYQGLARAVWYLVRTGEKGPGGSTITMQLARNLFLSSERTYLRKLREILLALRIERQFEKDKILELYLNKIYLGQRAYGVAAAAEVYYGRPLQELTLAQQAMIAGLPKAPSAWNPLADPERALQRRAYVLGRMLDSGFIDKASYEQAMAAPITAERHRRRRSVNAPFIAEMARSWAVARYGAEAAYTSGYEIYTTISAERQHQARDALRLGLHGYDERHGYRGPLTQLDPALLEGERAVLAERLSDFNTPGDLEVAVVTALDERSATLVTADGSTLELGWQGIEWARPQLGRNAMGPQPEQAADILVAGDVVYLRRSDGEWRLAQLPEPQAGLVALSPDDGRIEALVGGYDFSLSKFNRVTQAARQPGSAFKPLIYSAALANGFTPATLVNDAPVVFEDASLEDVWRPENYSGRIFGPTRLREALTYSRNLVSIRLLRQVGVRTAIDHIEQFGIPADRLAPNLSLALGAAEVTPLELAQAYAVFANGGYRVNPYYIERAVDGDGIVVYESWPARAVTAEAIEPPEPGPEGPRRPAARPAERAISAENAWLMRSMLQNVVQEGTARAARALGRSDLGGKTGTTNEQRDAWFSGFNGDLVVTAWVGFDELQTLGRYETGGRAALPIWTDFMGAALESRPESEWPRPDGLVTVRIDPESGELAGADTPGAIFETFREANLPSSNASADSSRVDGGGASSEQPIF
ncbi:penicillin-binding protein 1A [Spiribacter insolitus]|uniref:Penicillin-binding protein 1A n=1 Tax=Spiribacter insolitus TaxID=3122417 RepID=A0ABV3TAD0_9GAMM